MWRCVTTPPREPDEAFTVTLSNATPEAACWHAHWQGGCVNGPVPVLDDATATVTIVDDDLDREYRRPRRHRPRAPKPVSRLCSSEVAISDDVVVDGVHR